VEQSKIELHVLYGDVLMAGLEVYVGARLAMIDGGVSSLLGVAVSIYGVVNGIVAIIRIVKNALVQKR
jgi:hypothetical protein